MLGTGSALPGDAWCAEVQSAGSVVARAFPREKQTDPRRDSVQAGSCTGLAGGGAKRQEAVALIFGCQPGLLLSCPGTAAAPSAVSQSAAELPWDRCSPSAVSQSAAELPWDRCYAFGCQPVRAAGSSAVSQSREPRGPSAVSQAKRRA